MPALPDKYVPVEFSTFGVAALLMERLRPGDTVSSLWDRVRDEEAIRTFDRFSVALTLLHAGNLVRMDGGVLRPEATVKNQR